MNPLLIAFPLAAAVFLGIIGWALADGLSGSVTPQQGTGGIGYTFDGGINGPNSSGAPPVGCVGTGYDFTNSCNSQYIATF